MSSLNASNVDPAPVPSLRSLCNELATKYSVSPETLRSYGKRLLRRDATPHGNNLISRKNEARLVGFIMALETLGTPCAKSEVCI